MCSTSSDGLNMMGYTNDTKKFILKLSIHLISLIIFENIIKTRVVKLEKVHTKSKQTLKN